MKSSKLNARWIAMLGILLVAPWMTHPSVAAGPCVKAIEGAHRLSSGIATTTLEDAVLVELCDGGWVRVTVSEGAIRITRSTRISPARASGSDADMLPDGEVTFDRGLMAWLTGPTRRYAHGILGDDIEASGLHVVRRDGTSADLNLEGQAVFEDLRVRLVDLDGDGINELIAIQSDARRGAALAIYRVTDIGIAPLAIGPPIGRPYRWLNPAGVADFDGDGTVEIVYVETPHIGGILRLYSLAATTLTLEQSAAGYSNHAIGSRVLDMSAVIDWNADGIPDLAVPDASRRKMMIVSFAGGEHQVLAAIPHHAQIATAVMAADLDDDGVAELVYGLSDGSLIVTRP